MGRFPAGKLRFWRGQPVNAPSVTPPMSLRMMLVVCILSVTGTLAYAVLNQLGQPGLDNSARPATVLIAICYFLLPVLIATAISTNRAISRPLIVVYTCALAYQIAASLISLDVSPNYRNSGLLAVLVVLLAAFWWLYRSPRLRIYYALITDKPVPPDLEHSLDELTGPNKFEAGFARAGQFIATYLEIIAVLIIVAALVFGLSMTADGW